MQPSSLSLRPRSARDDINLKCLSDVPDMSSQDSSREYLEAAVLSDIFNGTPEHCDSFPRQGFLRGHFEVRGMPYRMVGREVKKTLIDGRHTQRHYR